MTKQEFLNNLRESLYTEVTSIEIENNIHYYSDYIDNEIRNGKREEEVMESLGDPRLIARTIIETSRINKGNKPTSDYSYDQEDNSTTQRSNNDNGSYYNRTYQFNGRMPLKYKVIGITAIILIFFLLIFVARVAIIILLKFGVPILLVYLLVKVLKGR